MGNQGRYGKYGEIKRLDRLRQSGRRTRPGPEQKGKEKPSLSPFGQSFHKRGLIRIRDASRRDRAFVGRLSGKVFRQYGPYQEMVTQWFDSETTSTLIAMVEGKAAGFAMVGYLLNDSGIGVACELLAIAVDPDKGRRGVGRKLLEETEKRVAKVGEERLFLHTAVENTGARRLFAASGYRPAGVRKHFYPAGQDALTMYKDTAIGRVREDESQG